MTTDGQVGLVLAGAPARGPYAAAALAELLPALAAEEQRPSARSGPAHDVRSQRACARPETGAVAVGVHPAR